MALTFPTPLSDFFLKLPIAECSPMLTESVEMNETGAGEILMADLGSRLWQMDVTLRGGNYDMERYRAMISVYRQSGRSFLAHAIPTKYPQADPRGTGLSGSSPTLYSVSSNMREVILGGLPNGYQLTAGDCISFQYGSNPVRYAFHQIVNDGVVGSNGRSELLEVTPAIRTGFATGVTVQLAMPRFKAVIIPGSYKPGKTGSRETSGISFSLMQTLRN